MKLLQQHVFNAKTCRKELKEFAQLLNSNPTLSERTDVLPFFRTRHDLSSLIGTYFPKLSNPDVLAHEFEIYGDFRADLVVGDSSAHYYLLVEFEDGTPESVFKKKGKRATRDWAPRFEGAYSQLVDWLWKLEDMRSTQDFVNTFGNRQATFEALIVIGKGAKHSDEEVSRLKWRMDRTTIDSNKVSCVSFDQLAANLDGWLRRYYKV